MAPNLGHIAHVCPMNSVVWVGSSIYIDNYINKELEFEQNEIHWHQILACCSVPKEMWLLTWNEC